jgi:ribonucleotide monophosphatase NagD (HAD superfamily)
MIGDSLNSDIAGATAAGLKSLLVRTGNSAAEPLPTSCDWELPSIAELPGWYQTQFGS